MLIDIPTVHAIITARSVNEPRTKAIASDTATAKKVSSIVSGINTVSEGPSRVAITFDTGSPVLQLLPKSKVLQTMFEMRHELAAVWGRSMATREQLVAQLQDWCRRAETSEIKPLAEFSRQLRCYA